MCLYSCDRQEDSLAMVSSDGQNKKAFTLFLVAEPFLLLAPCYWVISPWGIWVISPGGAVISPRAAG